MLNFMSRYAPTKAIPLPVIGQVDISDHLPLVNSREIQRLDYSSQLSLVRKTSPFANHTRLAHSYAVLGVTQKGLANLFNRDFFPQIERNQLKRDLETVALVHDVAHPPYGHVTESFLRAFDPKGKGHKERGIEMVKGILSKPISESGSDPENIARYLDKKNITPGQLVTSRAMGFDKLAYLFIDRLLTARPAKGPERWDDILHYLVFDSQGIAIEEKGADVVKGIQEMYFDMWSRAYYRKRSVGDGRQLQKAMQIFMETENINPEDVWTAKESWLDTRLEEAKSPVVRKIYDRISGRLPLKTALSFRYDRQILMERIAGKDLTVHEVNPKTLDEYTKAYENPLRLTKLENKIGNLLGIDPEDIVIGLPPEPEKLVPEDVRIVNRNGSDVGYLFGLWPTGRDKLLEEARSSIALRVMVPDKSRYRVSSAGKDVLKIIEEDYQSQKK